MEEPTDGYTNLKRSEDASKNKGIKQNPKLHNHKALSRATTVHISCFHVQFPDRLGHQGITCQKTIKQFTAVPTKDQRFTYNSESISVEEGSLIRVVASSLYKQQTMWCYTKTFYYIFRHLGYKNLKRIMVRDGTCGVLDAAFKTCCSHFKPKTCCLLSNISAYATFHPHRTKKYRSQKCSV